VIEVTNHLVGVAEIARMLGVSRQRVDAITRTDSSFPAPEVELTAGRVWRREEIEDWSRQHRRRSDS
jgi:predicted DNA-binding transcriptional regulator AlpA